MSSKHQVEIPTNHQPIEGLGSLGYLVRHKGQSVLHNRALVFHRTVLTLPNVSGFECLL